VNELLVNAVELLRRPGTERSETFETTISSLGIVDARLPDGPVSFRARLEVLSDGIVVSGEVRARWVGECRRCLSPVGGEVAVPVHELYQVRVSDPEAFPIEHDQLDLGPMLREALLLDTPSSPLCRADCAGICALCGADRNAAPCACDTSVRDDRWAALDALRDDSR
jgi:uncharacterized protein